MVRALPYCVMDPRLKTHCVLMVGDSLTALSPATKGKELATLTHKADGLGKVSSLTDTPQSTDHIWGLLYLTFQQHGTTDYNEIECNSILYDTKIQKGEHIIV